MVLKSQISVGFLALSTSRAPRQSQAFLLIFSNQKADAFQAHFDLNSTVLVAVRIENAPQRTGENIFDIDGKVYNTTANPVTLESIEYSVKGDSGPWLPTTILTSDPLYSFPTVGTPAGEAFKAPVEIASPPDFPQVWFRLKMTY